MPRVKTGTNRRSRHNKVVSLAAGYQRKRRTHYRLAHTAIVKALSCSYSQRRERKGDMRRLWNLRIGAASRALGLKYNQLIDGLTKSGVEINRKMLADMAVKEPAAFAELVTVAKSKLQ